MSLRRVRGDEVSGSKIHKYWRRSEKAKESEAPCALGKGLDFEDSREVSWLMRVLLYPNQLHFVRNCNLPPSHKSLWNPVLSIFYGFPSWRKIKSMIPTRKKLLFSHRYNSLHLIRFCGSCRELTWNSFPSLFEGTGEASKVVSTFYILKKL